jgi:hypothetical protein
MSATASFSIDSSDVHYSKRVSWNNTTLVKTESIFHFSFAFVHESFSDFNALTDNLVGIIFNVLLFLFG